MSYFVQPNARHQSPSKKHGKHVGAVEQKEPAHVVTRDERIEQNIREMQVMNGTGTEDFLMKHVSKQNVPAGGLKFSNVPGKQDNNVFGEPKLATPPKRRLRIGVSDDELKAIWKQDDKKDRIQAAQKVMEHKPNMVDMMKNDRPVYQQVMHPVRKASVVAAVIGTKDSDFQMDGFRGMGGNCKGEAPRGKSNKTQGDFVPPELPPRSGRRSKFPADSFSFQEDAQTASAAPVAAPRMQKRPGPIS